MELVTKTAIVTLTEDEKLDYGVQAGQMEKLICQLDDQKRALSKELKSFKDERHRLLKAIEQGEEERTIECSVEYDFENSIVSYIYRGDIVDQRKMEDSDRQLALDQQTPKKTKLRKAKGRKKKLDESEMYGDEMDH